MRLPIRALLLALLLAVPAVGRAAILNGRITDPNGNGVHPLDIDVRDNKTGVLLATPDDTTNVNGDYSIVVPAGKYDLTFKPAPGSHLFAQTRNGISVTTVATTNRTLQAGQYLSGRFVDSNGAGIPSVNLNFFDAAGNAVTLVQDDGSDATGNFNTLVQAGVLDLEVMPTVASRKVPRQYKALPLAGDVALGTITLQSGHLVTGSITDASLFPLVGADFDVRIAGTSSKLFTPNDNTGATGSTSFVIPAGLYDITGTAPSGSTAATRTAWAVHVTADMTLPVLVLPPGVALTAHCVTTGGVPVPNVDCDADSLPFLHRLQTPHDVTDALGNVSVQVAPYKYRVNYAPPVSTKLLPVVFDSLQINAASNLGNIVHQAGHWVSVNVKETYTNLPLQGVNLDFVDELTGKTFMTIDDVTNNSGFAKVVTDSRRFTLFVRGPSTSFQTITLGNFRTLADTTLNLSMAYSTAGVDAAHAAPLQLSAPWPNPARGAVSLAATALAPQGVELSVWDLAGRRITTLHDGPLAGQRTFVWNTRDGRGTPVPPGVYLLRLSDGRTTTTRRVAVMN